MSFLTLVQWIQVADAQEAQAGGILPLVEAAYCDIEEQDPRYSRLVDIEKALLDGLVPWELLQELARDHQTEPGPTDCERLEAEFREVASGLPESEWRTETFDRLLSSLHAWEQGDSSKLTGFLEETSANVRQTWESYCDSPLFPEEITAETAVGHILLEEGCRGWMTAVELGFALLRGEGDFDLLLDEAEQANRLLVAVGRLNERVQCAKS